MSQNFRLSKAAAPRLRFAKSPRQSTDRSRSSGPCRIRDGNRGECVGEFRGMGGLSGSPIRRYRDRGWRALWLDHARYLRYNGKGLTGPSWYFCW
ncbi:hypothetical protein MPLDJ20_20301 [Mesorhizobium plurifarium]|uniref:Uncharacterized protein n=1 Tax=Mesorhizobium plurifarium TaxID=69974 RepID=A0A090GKN4_MESPL|nr:hypothetical protein MPLDJ20_20301 [Mesorhizobium plurifarium]